MPSKTKPLSAKELAKFEASRDLGAELLQSIREMKAGKVRVAYVCVRPSHLDPGHETVVSGQAAGDQRCGSSSSIRLAGCVGSRSSTSLKYA